MIFDAPKLRGLGVDRDTFWDVMIGECVFVTDPKTGYEEKARYIVADELTLMASEAAKTGRPDRCGLLNSIVTRVRSGRYATKRQANKAARELHECARRLDERQPRAERIYPSARVGVKS